MSQATIAGIKPIAVELKTGEKYYFCTCGRSNNQPFCDLSHKGTSFTPKAFTADKYRTKRDRTDDSYNYIGGKDK